VPTVSTNFELQLGKMLNAEAAAGPDQRPYVRNVNVQWDRLDLTDLATMHFDAADTQRFALQQGDLLVCEGGEVGRAAVWPGGVDECYFQKAIHRVRPRAGANSRFLMYCLRAAAKRSVFAVEGNTSTIVHLTGEQLRVHRFPWPPPEEQSAIVAHLDRLAKNCDAAVSTINRQIELLTERRQALITAAVTGQLEIPGVAA
jgi:type I restriction enzyme S subunit